MLDLVGNPEGMFSSMAAQLTLVTLCNATGREKNYMEIG